MSVTLKQVALHCASTALAAPVVPLVAEGQPFLALLVFLAWLNVFVTLCQDLDHPKETKPWRTTRS